MRWIERPLRRGDLTLATYDAVADDRQPGPDDRRDGPPILFVHGYPQTHAMWQGVVERLVDRFRCLAYDVRGAGRSTAPASRAGYRLERLRADLAAVVDARSPDRPVHLVGHDWGSIQLWDAVVRDAREGGRLADRIASFTSISGPCLHHLPPARRLAWRGGWRARSALVGQFAHSAYVGWFQVPALPERLLARAATRRLRRSPTEATSYAATLSADCVHGLELYRANMFVREPMNHPPCTDVPVQLLVLTKDRYVGPVLVDHVGRFAGDLTRTEVEAGHWAPQTHPDEVAAAVAAYVTGRTRAPDAASPPPG